MSTIEIKNELHAIIDNGDEYNLKGFYTIIKEYLQRSENSKMIAESEIDIKLGNIHSQAEVQKMIENWTE
jgi:hypothetical protein